MQTGSMSTSAKKYVLQDSLKNVPSQFRDKVLKYYQEIKKDFVESRCDSIKSGKFCETILRLLQFEVTGSFTKFGTKIDNFYDECRKLIVSNTSKVNDSQRVIIPRALAYLYTFRNKRDIGHAGGDVDANLIDLATITRVCDWVMCELIRIYHKLPLEDAQDIIDSLSQRTLPAIWEVGGKKRVLNTQLDCTQKVLLLLYSELNTNVLLEDLFDWVEYSNMAVFRKMVLAPLHKEKYIEFDQESNLVVISPKGNKKVEEEILTVVNG